MREPDDKKIREERSSFTEKAVQTESAAGGQAEE
jgi:hypothetical protein